MNSACIFSSINFTLEVTVAARFKSACIAGYNLEYNKSWCSLIAFCAFKPCSPVRGYKRFTEIYLFQIEDSSHVLGVTTHKPTIRIFSLIKTLNIIRNVHFQHRLQPYEMSLYLSPPTFLGCLSAHEDT